MNRTGNRAPLVAYGVPALPRGVDTLCRRELADYIAALCDHLHGPRRRSCTACAALLEARASTPRRLRLLPAARRAKDGHGLPRPPYLRPRLAPVRSISPDDTADQRRDRMGRDIEYVLDAFADDEAGAYVDPLLDLAYPVGTGDGQVKTLRHWTAEDFDTSTRMAYRKAAEITASAREHDEAMTAAVQSMRARGTARFAPLSSRPALGAA